MQLCGMRIVKVIGRSMEPALPRDSFAVFWRAKQPRAGDIVLADHPEFGRIIKKVIAVENGKLSLAGTSAESTPAARLGRIGKDRVLGRLLFKIKEPERSIYG